MNEFDKNIDDVAGPKAPKKAKGAKLAGSSQAEPGSGGVNKKRVFILLASTAVVVSLIGATAYIFAASRSGGDIGAGNPNRIAPVPTVQNDNFAPVGSQEADRRATVNDELAHEAADRGDSHVSQTVIADKYQVGDERDPYEKELRNVEPRIEAPKADAPAEPEPKVVEKIVYVDRPLTDPIIDPSIYQKLESQITFAQKPQQSRFVAMAFKKPEPAQPPQPVQAAGSGAVANIAGNFDPSSLKRAPQLAAKPGDIFYGQLWLGFNSDDPRGAPVFATIYDNRSYRW